jgi:uracil-DNA glycosylase
MVLSIVNGSKKVKGFPMVEMEERELLLQSLKGYLEELRDTGVEELVFAGGSSPTVGPGAPMPGISAAGASLAGASGTVTPASEAAKLPLTGAGDPGARLLFVLTGAGLASPSGELFAKIIKAMGFAPQEVYLLSFAQEAPGAATASRASLLEAIATVAPRIVVALGETAAQLLLQSGDPISALRGRFVDLEGTPLMATLHPDQLLADDSLKREVWNEMQQVMKRL